MLSYLFLVKVVTVKWSHAPIIRKEFAPFPVFVDLVKKKLTLNHKHSLIAYFLPVYPLSMLLIYKLSHISAFTALKQESMGFILIHDMVALGYGFN